MKGTIADIRQSRKIVAAQGKQGVKLPPSRDMETVTTATEPSGLSTGQLPLQE